MKPEVLDKLQVASAADRCLDSDAVSWLLDPKYYYFISRMCRLALNTSSVLRRAVFAQHIAYT